MCMKKDPGKEENDTLIPGSCTFSYICPAKIKICRQQKLVLQGQIVLANFVFAGLQIIFFARRSANQARNPSRISPFPSPFPPFSTPLNHKIPLLLPSGFMSK